MAFNKFISFLVFLTASLTFSSVQADYIVLKKSEKDGIPAWQNIGADDLSAAQQRELFRIMMTYEWPRVIASDKAGLISKADAQELFSPTANAEHIFLSKKIQSSPLLGADFNLVFIPKTVYELFVISSKTYEKIDYFANRVDPTFFYIPSGDPEDPYLSDAPPIYMDPREYLKTHNPYESP